MIACAFENDSSFIIIKAKKVRCSKFDAECSNNYYSTGLQDAVSCVSDYQNFTEVINLFE